MNSDSTVLIIYLAVMFGGLYFFFIAPQRRQRRQMQEMLEALAPGDEVLTAGGLYGKIVSIQEDSLHIEIADGVVVKVAKAAVSGRKAPAAAADE